MPAIGPVQALELYQKSTFATSANRLAKCTVRPSFKYSGKAPKLPRLGLCQSSYHLSRREFEFACCLQLVQRPQHHVKGEGVITTFIRDDFVGAFSDFC